MFGRWLEQLPDGRVAWTVWDRHRLISGATDGPREADAQSVIATKVLVALRRLTPRDS